MKKLSVIKVVVVGAILSTFLSGCTSSQMQKRKAERDRISEKSKLYCEFINGDMFPDIEVQLNIEMAKRCDSSKPYSISSYKTPSEAPGIMYCCALPGAVDKTEVNTETKEEPKKE